MASSSVLLCCECEDTPAVVRCCACDDPFCSLCFQWQHSRGKRMSHQVEHLTEAGASALTGTTAHFMAQTLSTPQSTTTAAEAPMAEPPQSTSHDVKFLMDWRNVYGATEAELAAMHLAPLHIKWLKDMTDELISLSTSELQPLFERRLGKYKDLVNSIVTVRPPIELENPENSPLQLEDRAHFMPLRLTDEERGLLDLLEYALNVSEYTDKVDVARYDWIGFTREAPNRQGTMRAQLVELLAICCGLFFSRNYKAGRQLALSPDDSQAKDKFLLRLAEIGRRYKILNPDKMRASYGKLVCILQDCRQHGLMPTASMPSVQTVYAFLKSRNALSLLTEDAAVTLQATRALIEDPFHPHRDMAAEAKAKRAAYEQLCAKYTPALLSVDELERVCFSIADNWSFIVSNRVHVDKMILHLFNNFHPDQKKCTFSLKIKHGVGGSHITHDHATQYAFVLQSFMLWREVLNNCHRLWFDAEDDLIGENAGYRLGDTGQGLHRIQGCPHVGRSMHAILSRVQAKVKSWVGLSVVHLGDRDVPNSLVFIDKYIQVPRLLAPIVATLDTLAELCGQYEEVASMLDTHYEGLDRARETILADFFKHGFDGSGSDGGSCIDGRLTSAWNWCSKIAKKEYYPLFLLCGFQGFDGSFR